jgi:hypothetical protein
MKGHINGKPISRMLVDGRAIVVDGVYSHPTSSGFPSGQILCRPFFPQL